MSQEREQYQSQVESKASDSERIAEPVATREAIQESHKSADDMIEGVSSRSVAISARSEGQDITTRAISSPAVHMIPHDVVNDASDRIQRTVRSRSHSHDSVDSVRIAESDSEGAGHVDSISPRQPFEEEPNATGPLLAAYQHIHRLTKLADRHKKELRVARHDVRAARAKSTVAESLVDGFASALGDRLSKLAERDEAEAPWCSLTERMPSPSGPLLAAYDAVDALQHRVEFHREQYADVEVALEQLKVYTVSCEGRIKEFQEEIDEAERDWDELDSRHQEQSIVVQSQARRISDLERTMSSTKALMAAHAEKDKEYQSLREQWEVLATAALARDHALAKAQEEVRRLNSTNQQLSVTSADSAERLAAVTADRETRLKTAQTMYNVQKDKTTRIAKERDYYKTSSRSCKGC